MPRPSLRRTLIVTFALVCTLPILVLATWFYPNLRQHTVQAAASHNLATAQNLAASVHGQLVAARQALHAVSVFATHEDDEQEIAAMMGRQGHFRTVLLVNQAQILKRWPAAATSDPTPQDRAMLNEVNRYLKPDAPKHSGVIRSPYDGQPTMLLLERSGENLVVGLLDLSDLVQLAQRVRIGERGFAAITDQTGYVVSSADEAWIQQIVNLSEWPAVSGALQGKSGTASFPIKDGGEPYLAGFAPVAEFGWAVLTPQPLAELQASSNNLLRAAAWVGLASLGLGLALAVAISCWIARPISALAKVVQALPSTGYQADFEKLAKIAPRELDTLQHRSKQMAKEVRNAIALRDRMNDELARLVDRATRGLKEANSQLAQQALVDDLTKLHNRRALWQRISDLERSQPDSYLPVQVLVFDLDNFKEINDTLGHAAGDQVLMHVAAILEQQTRDGDFAVRYGGDEFLVVMPHCSPEIAKERARAIRRAVMSQPIDIDNRKINIHMSVGIAESESKLSRPSFNELLKAADRAMYAAKRQNKLRNNLVSI